MNLEFHYYVTSVLALEAGYPPEAARRIGRSCQEVDAALLSWEVSDAGPYRTAKTQDYVFWDESVFREIYLPFHFLPGEPEKAAAARRDGRADPWIVTPDSPLARELLTRALRSGNDYRIGIALHSYADSWAHQNFSGKQEATNELGGRSPLPPVGHLQALKSPDDCAGLWTDPRLHEPDIDNSRRFAEAARMIFRFLRTSLRRGFEGEAELLDRLRGLWTRRQLSISDRLLDYSIDWDIELWDRQAWRVEAGLGGSEETEERPAGYEKLRWIGQRLALHARGEEGLRLGSSGGRFLGSDLHRWSEAALAHRELALDLIRQRLGSLGSPETRQA